MKIYESAEDYLETILILSQRLPVVRSIDVVKEMGFSKPSVSIAMKHLKEGGKILVDENGFITLTDEGRAIAEMIYSRHLFFKGLLLKIGVEEKVAEDEACHLEHDISQDTFEKLREWVKTNHPSYF